MTTQDEFSGAWRFTHWYPSSDDSTEENDVHDMEATMDEGRLVLESPPDKGDSYMFVRLKIDGDVASGSWHEHAKKNEFGGAMYSGAGQLIVSDDKRKMEGLWAGAGVDRTTGKLKIYTGRWELVRTPPVVKT